MHRMTLAFGFSLLSGVAFAQAQAPFVPFTMDAAAYQKIDDAMARMNMPREAHAAWINFWQSIEQAAQRQAALDAARAEKKIEPPPQESQK